MSQAPAPPDTKSLILQAAIKLFSEKGFNGASIADIARECGVTKSLVMYHYPTKDALWEEAVDGRLGPFMSIVERFIASDPDVTLRDLIHARARMHQDNPEIVRMISWMSLEGNICLETKTEQVHKLLAKLETLKGQGGLPGNVRPVMFMGLLMAAVDGWFHYRAFLGALAKEETATEESLREYLDAVDKVFFRTQG